MGGSDSPLLQLSFDPRLRRGSRVVIYLLKKGQPLFEGAGKKKNIGRSTFRNAFCFLKVLLTYILSFYAHTTLHYYGKQLNQDFSNELQSCHLNQGHSGSQWQGQDETDG